MNKINKFAKNGYNDSFERNAFKRMVRSNNTELRNFIKTYCKLDINDGPFKEIDDPLGLFKVDMGIVDKNGKIVCLVEVDVFNSWKSQWPSYYKWCHRLARKEKYWINTPYPYINITFSADHKNGIMTTREIEKDYPIKKKWFKMQKMWEEVREIPIPNAIKIGEWA